MAEGRKMGNKSANRDVRRGEERFATIISDPRHLAELEAAFEAMLKRSIRSAQDLEELISDLDSIVVSVRDAEARASVAVTCNTEDRAADERYSHLIQVILPALDRGLDGVHAAIIESPWRDQLPDYYRCYLREIKNERALFREEALPIKSALKKLEQEFDKITGGWTVALDGKELTVQQAREYYRNPDRSIRRTAAEAIWKVRLESRERLHRLYDTMIEKRVALARVCGFSNFRDYSFQAKRRFEYGPAECEAFWKGVETHVVPLNVSLAKRRAKALGIERCEPFDFDVETLAASDSRRMQPDSLSIEELIEKCERVFASVHPGFGAAFRQMRGRKLLDLESRKAKAPGGYMTEFPVSGDPFIFMNAVGSPSDVRTLLHEGGHCFHYLLAREKQPHYFYQNPPLEFAEVGSMTMELFARRFMGEFYSGERLQYLLEKQLVEIVSLLGRIAVIDAFQHWAYLNPKHSWDEREAKAVELTRRYTPEVDWSKVPEVERLNWIYPHIFCVPFYYIEYGIAQLGALHLWTMSETDFDRAVAAYRTALSIGSSKPLPELFSAIERPFDFGPESIEASVSTVRRELGL